MDTRRPQPAVLALAIGAATWWPVRVHPDPLNHIRQTHQLVAAGYSHRELARLTRAGDLIRLRRGAYAWAPDGVGEGTPQHERLILATQPQLAPDSVVSHLSAAVLHGLPIWGTGPARVQVTRTDQGRGKRRGHVHLHVAALEVAEVTEIRGVRVTSLARTVVDLGRSSPLEQAVMAGDAALRAGCSQDELQAVLTRARSRPGVATARRAVGFLDARSESPGESLSRVTFSRLGLPAPDLQFSVFDGRGSLVGRTDFCWEAQRTLGEFDGRIKYGALRNPGERPEDVVYREKRREDALRDLGWQLVRWSWSDLGNLRALADRIHRAFARGEQLRALY